MSNIPENVLVDDIDRPMLEAMGKWYVNRGYCIKKTSRKLGKRKNLQMHRVIMCPPDDMFIDHINGNTLDNRRCNLRIVTTQQNAFNRLGAKGCRWDEKRKKFYASIGIGGKYFNLGRYDTKEEARAAYEAAKARLHVIP